MHISKAKFKDTQSLLTKKGRKFHKKYLIEGIKLIEEAFTSNKSINALIYVKDSKSPEVLDQLLEKVTQMNIPIYWAFDKQMAKLTEQKNPEGIIAIVNQEAHNTSELNSSVIVASDGISDPGNFGTIIRSALWFGIKDFLVSKNSVEIYSPKVLRSTMGAHFKAQFQEAELINSLQEYKEKGYHIVATTLSNKSKDLNEVAKDIHKDNKYIIIFGNESKGIRKEILDIADFHIKIPGSGNQESLNVAISAGIVLYELTNHL